MTGYVALVKRKIDSAEKSDNILLMKLLLFLDCRHCFFTSASTSNKSTFMAQLNSSYGSGGMTLALNKTTFSLFIQFIKNENIGNLPILKAAIVIGQQGDKTWVVNKNLQITEEGHVVEEDNKKYVWMDEIILRNLPNSIRLEEVYPLIKGPFDDTSVISE